MSLSSRLFPSSASVLCLSDLKLEILTRKSTSWINWDTLSPLDFFLKLPPTTLFPKDQFGNRVFGEKLEFSRKNYF